jgi:hypothetical protein
MPFSTPDYLQGVLFVLKAGCQQMTTVPFIGCNYKQAVINYYGESVSEAIIFHHQFNGSAFKNRSDRTAGIHKHRPFYIREIKSADVGNVRIVGCHE